VDTREIYDGLAGLYVPVAVVVFVLVVGALGFALLHRRAVPDDAPRAEIAYAAVLAAIAAVLIVFTFRATDRENARAAAPEVVRVTAGKWTWHFAHHGRVEEDLLTVPAGVPIEFRGTSVDVIHGFWVPGLKFQRQLIPGRETRFSLVFERPGFVTSGACSFFCGLDHARMRFGIDVVSRSEFDAWVRG
jgi:cytochrome c oxidase subunit II